MKIKAKGPFLIISHPDKGTFRLYLMDDNDIGPDYYVKDKELCKLEVCSRGVVIDGKIETNPIKIKAYLDIGDEAIQSAAVKAIESGKTSDNEELLDEVRPHLGSIEFDEAVNECMSKKGWVTRMGTKADLD